MRKILGLAAAGVLVLASAAHAQRDQIRIVGSSTVYPFSAKVAEAFGRAGTLRPRTSISISAPSVAFAAVT